MKRQRQIYCRGWTLKLQYSPSLSSHCTLIPFKEKKTNQNKTENPGLTPAKTQRNPRTHKMNWCKLYARIQRKVVQFSPNFWLLFWVPHTIESPSFVFQLGIVSLFSFSFYLSCCLLAFFSKIQRVVYHQCCILFGWATRRLYVIAH